MKQKATLFLFSQEFYKLNKYVNIDAYDNAFYSLESLKTNKKLLLEDDDNDGFLYEFEIEVNVDVWLDCLLQSLDGDTDPSWIGETVIFTKRHEFHDFLKGL